LKKANQCRLGVPLRKLTEKHAKELLREVKRLRAKEAYFKALRAEIPGIDEHCDGQRGAAS
jgi:hypothetical protein